MDLLTINDIQLPSKFQVAPFSLRLETNEQWAFVADESVVPSALLEAIAGRIHITSGEIAIHFHGEKLLDRDKATAIVSSHYHFRTAPASTAHYYQERFNLLGAEDSFTVRQFLSGSAEQGFGNSWTFDSITDRLRLKQLLDKLMIMLSNGETRHVMIAAAMIKNPLILLLDHPFAGLDTNARQDMRSLIGEVARAGQKVIIAVSTDEIPDSVTHVALFEGTAPIYSGPRGNLKVPHKKRSSSMIDVGQLSAMFPASHEKHEIAVGMSNVSVRYGERLILENINWTVRQSERWLISGPNGAGKSTLLALINGDHPQAYANKIILFDRLKGSGESIWAIKRRIGFVSPELFRYFPAGQTCFDVVASGLYDFPTYSHSPENRKRVEDWLRCVGLEKFSGKMLSEVAISTQRLCLLLRALIKGPSLLILDEPYEGLRRSEQEAFMTLIDQVCKATDVTLIMVSHYTDQVPHSTTRVLSLESGRVAGITEN